MHSLLYLSTLSMLIYSNKTSRFQVTDDCVIVHKGSSSLDDFVKDLESELDCSAFERSLDEFYLDQLDAITQSKCTKFTGTGHSLGGATVELLSLRNPSLFTDIVTFGAPRLACTNITLTPELSRVHLLGDPVPALPLNRIHPFGGHLVELYNDKCETIADPSQQAPRPGNPNLYVVKHRIVNYVNTVRSNPESCRARSIHTSLM